MNLRNIISGSVQYPVVLGQANYGDRLTVTSTGTIHPLYAAYAGLTVPGTLQTARVLNQGQIIGGQGFNYYAGGVGVSLGAGHLDNAGTIRGGAGGYGFRGPDNGDSGGVGLAMSGGRAVNSNVIDGGAGGPGYYVGGTGNSSVDLTGGTLVNHGTLMGGHGGTGDYVGGDGGVGVVLSGSTLVDFGLIGGGSGGSGARGGGGTGAAVQFGSAAGTLVLEPGARIGGAVHANSGVADTLVLAGHSAASVDGLGSSGFSLIEESAGATWTLTGSVSGAGSVSIGHGASLTLSGIVSVATIAFTSGAATLALGTPVGFSSTVTGFGRGDVIDLQGLAANSLSYGGGTLTLLQDGNVVDKLLISGDYIGADFGLRPDGSGGTEVYGQNPFTGHAAFDTATTPAGGHAILPTADIREALELGVIRAGSYHGQ